MSVDVRTQLPVGTRVHHRGGVYSRYWNPAPGEGGSYWGSIVEVDPREWPDGSTEYLIQADAPLLPDWPNPPRYWASYHLDRWVIPAREGARRE